MVVYRCCKTSYIRWNLFSLLCVFVFFFFLVGSGLQLYELDSDPERKEFLDSASSSFSARFPHSAQPSSLTETGIQHNRSSVSVLRAPIGGDQFSQTETQKENHC